MSVFLNESSESDSMIHLEIQPFASLVNESAVSNELFEWIIQWLTHKGIKADYMVVLVS